ncbi:MAG: DNA translocase FtsK [Firmicutes bacterium]|nr:DNA translocase FtsK [Bacillota bacterium]
MSKHAKVKDEIRTQIKGLLLLAVAVFCYAGLHQSGQTGEVGLFIHNVLRTLAGETAVVIPFLIGFYALREMLPQKTFHLKSRLAGVLILLLLFMVSAHFQVMMEEVSSLSGEDFYRASFNLGREHQGGGVVGAVVAMALYFFFRDVGSKIVLATLAAISLLLITNVSLTQIWGGLKQVFLFLVRLIVRLGKFLKEIYHILMVGEEEEAGEFTEKKIEEVPVEEPYRVPIPSEPALPSDKEIGEAGSEPAAVPAIPPVYQAERRLTLVDAAEGERGEQRVKTERPAGTSDYRCPSLDLLTKGGRLPGGEQLKNIKERARLLENTLQSFGVNARVINAQTGPTVTRFEVQPEAGVKVSRIVSLSDDLALNLAAPLVRIEAPIPGKAALGIEVPNKRISMVYLRDVLESSSFQEHPSLLTVGLGKDITGVPVIADLAKMPHLLIAGATGSGKSVCLNTIILSLLYKSNPDQLRFLMIDPKVVELSAYNGIPQLLSPVITEPKKAALALRNMVREMGKRYELFAREKVRDIFTYNELCLKQGEPEESLPFVVIIIDELADLMLVSPGEVEDAIARLAQMSRAAGIHLVIATQRPSVDVLTGIIKANITSRVAFTVSSQVDSRTILDMAGAEKLLGRGDMLFYPVGTVKPFRVQGAYVSEKEIGRVAAYIRDQGEADYEEHLISPEIDERLGEMDELFPEAVELVARSGQASISLLQRRFRIGYTRAARLIDDLEQRGVVGQFEGSKPREVIITPEQAARLYEELKQKADF